jgi:hypothetical protein
LFDQISKAEEADIGKFSTNNLKFVKLNNRFHEIRTKKGSFNFRFLSDEFLSDLFKTKLLNGVFKDLQPMYKFVIHTHKVYKVPLDQNAELDKSKALLDTMETPFVST